MGALDRKLHLLGWPVVAALFAVAAYLGITGRDSLVLLPMLAGLGLCVHLLRTAVLPDMSSTTYEAWLKGGVRFKKLQKDLPRHVPDPPIRDFFVARLGHPNMTATYAVPFAFLRLREYVVAQTDGALHLLKISGIPIFSAKLSKPLKSWPLAVAPLAIDDKIATLDGTDYSIAPYHDVSANAVADAVAEARAPSA